MISIFVVCVIGFSVLGFVFGYKQYQQNGNSANNAIFRQLKSPLVLFEFLNLGGMVLFSGIYTAIKSNEDNVSGIVFVPVICLHGLSIFFSVADHSYNRLACTIAFLTLLETTVFMLQFYYSMWAWVYVAYVATIPPFFTYRFGTF